MFAPYDIPDAQIDAYDVVVNKPRSGAYRAPGLPQVSFAAEQVIDELAVRLGMDPIDFRLKNIAHDGKLTDFGCIYSSRGPIGVEEVLRRAKSSAHYGSQLIGPNRGRGVALAYWCNYGETSSCVINVNDDGSVSLVTGSVDLSGTRTTIAMQVAEVLGISLDHVKSTVGDTDSIGYTGNTGGSRTTFATGLAAINAAHHVIAQMCQHAALLWNVKAQDVTFEQGSFTNLQDSTKRMSFSELTGWITATGSVVTGSGYANPKKWDGTFVSHIADVQVDPETGKVDVLRYTVVQDVGKAVHPGLVEGQMQGGAVQGIGFGLYEGYQYNPQGEMLNPNFTDYKIPTATDVPMIEPIMVEVPGSNHPFGVRGVGEAPIIPAPAALANAIYRATGMRQSRLPMTPARILESMGVI